MTGALRRTLAWLVALVWLLAGPAAQAHPLPNSLVVLTPSNGRVTIDVDAPADDLAIAMRAEQFERTGATGAPQDAGRVAGYFLRHVRLADSKGRRLPLAARSAALVAATDPQVGGYREWRIRLVADSSHAAPGAAKLSYDAILHQIPNQVALVRIGARAAHSGRDAEQVGVIRYDFATGTINPLSVDLAGRGLLAGVGSMIALGFVHVLSGLDHILFLVALLMIVPFEADARRWRFRGMDGAAFRRFTAISLAFTLGHSASLAAGTFGFDAIPTRVTEVLVAVSIVVAAAHALRPLFPKREWLVALGFGLIHGLAFSQTLAAFDLDVAAKIGALFGFNIGVECAQLTVMGLALPVLAVSGAPLLSRPRQIALTLVALVACLWIANRGFGLPLPAWLMI